MTEASTPSLVRVTNRPLTVVALMLAIFMAAMEVTVVSTAMPTVVGRLGGVDLYAWVFAAYVLVSTIGIPIFGKLADLYGRKPVILGGIVVFLVGSIACGQAHTMALLIAFRAVQGLGAGAMQSMSLTIVGDIFTLHERSRMQGVMGAVWGVAGLVGPLAGGLIVKLLGWPWVFYINVPFGLASMVLLAIHLHERVEVQRRPLDWLGALLLGVAVTALLVGARGSAALVALPIGVGCAALFLWVEKRAPEPLLPLDLFRIRVLSVASAGGALIGGSLLSALTFVPLFVQGVAGGSPTEAGAAIAPMAIGWPLASALAGRLLPKVGFRPLVRAGLALNAIAAIGLAVMLDADASPGLPRFLMALFGIGLGFANTALLIAVQSSVGWQRRGVTTASTMLFRMLGGALAVGGLGELLAKSLRDRPELVRDAARLLSDPTLHEGGASHHQELARVLAASLHQVFWVIAAMSTAAFAIGLAFPRIDFDREPTPSGEARP
jgi:EmrB/QacA subfamily drug resistance transporter